jgi:hypothetical protein
MDLVRSSLNLLEDLWMEGRIVASAATLGSGAEACTLAGLYVASLQAPPVG